MSLNKRQSFGTVRHYKKFSSSFFHPKIALTPKNILPCTKALNKMKAERNFLCDFSPVDFINKMNINYSFSHLRSHVLKLQPHSLAAAFSSLTFSCLHKAVSWEDWSGSSIKLRLCITYRHFLRFTLNTTVNNGINSRPQQRISQQKKRLLTWNETENRKEQKVKIYVAICAS